MSHIQKSRRRLVLLIAALAVVVLGVGLALYGPMMFSASGTVPPELKPFPTANPDGLKPSPIKPAELKPFPKKE